MKTNEEVSGLWFILVTPPSAAHQRNRDQTSGQQVHESMCDVMDGWRGGGGLVAGDFGGAQIRLSSAA